MTSKQTEALKLALEAQIHKAGMNPIMQGECFVMHPQALHKIIEVAIREALAEQPAQQQEPVAWMPIEQMYPQAKAIDILMGDGSILCAVLPQFDGDLWWEGSGTGEKFIDPKYANVTHWRIHDERTSPPYEATPLANSNAGQRSVKPWVGLTDEELEVIANECRLYPKDFAQAIEAKLMEKNHG